MEPSVLGNTDRPGSWGSGITEDEDKLTLFKLSLLHPDDLRQINEQHPERIAAVRDAFSKLDTAGKRGVDVVAEYLRRLWAAGKPQILAEIHRKGLTLAGVEIRFVFGIPAVWGEDAASRMKEAINKSHVLQLPGRLPASVSFIAEPEAAAIAVLPRAVQSGRLKVRLLSRRALPSSSFPRTCSITDLVARGSPSPPFPPKQNRETVVICDCGGGTVVSKLSRLGASLRSGRRKRMGLCSMLLTEAFAGCHFIRDYLDRTSQGSGVCSWRRTDPGRQVHEKRSRSADQEPHPGLRRQREPRSCRPGLRNRNHLGSSV